MPLADFKTREITPDYLSGLDREQLLELLNLKTSGLMIASRLQLLTTPEAQTIAEELKKIQDELARRDTVNS